MRPAILRLEGLSPILRGRTWEAGGPVRVGRLPTLEGAIPDSSLSRIHAELAPTEKGWVVRDLGSTNGTYLNGERLGRAEVAFVKQDSLQFGNIVLKVADINDRPPTPRGPAPED